MRAKLGRECASYPLAMRMWLLSYIAVATLTLQPAQAAKITELCPWLTLRGPESLSFTDSEKLLACGDPKSRAWRSVPESQALFHVRTFLQDRGYYFSKVERQGESVVLELGKRSFIKGMELIDEPPQLRNWNRNAYNGELLTPNRLTEITNSIEAKLGTVGYACPKVDVKANAETGMLSIRIQAGPQQPFFSVDEEKIKGLAPGVLRRYDAFVLGSTFNQILIPLTVSRTLSDGIVRNTYFNTRCGEKGVELEQKVFAGAPRQVTWGIGVNTDQGALTRASWKHGRLGPMGSSLYTQVKLTYKPAHPYSFNTQEGRIEGAWYVLESPSRFHLRPLFVIAHQADNRQDLVTSTLQLSPATTWDRSDTGGFISLGPALTGTMKFRGEGRDRLFFLALIADARLTSHDFEWFRSTPKSGFEILFTGIVSRKGWLADFTSEVLRGRYTHLWNFPADGRSQLILGFRTGLSMTFARQNEGGLDALTPDLRNYAGGSSTLRGFNYKELPDDRGALTTFFSGVEARGTGILPLDLQPFLFLDVGLISRDTFDLTDTWVASPGLGLRWGSPVGVFRTSLGYGVGLNAKLPEVHKHAQFHFSYGEEF